MATDPEERDPDREVVASSLGHQALPETEEEDEPFSDPDRIIVGFMAGSGMAGLAFAAALVGCLFDDGDDPDDPLPMMDPPRGSNHARNCVFIAASIGYVLGPVAGLAVIHDGDAFPGMLGLGFLGAAIGVAGALTLTLLTDVHAGVDVVYWLTLPVTFAVLGYEISGRIRRRRRNVQATIAPRIGRRSAGLALDMRF